MDRFFATGFRSIVLLPLSLTPLLLTPGCIIDADLGNSDTEDATGTGTGTGTPSTSAESTGEPPGNTSGGSSSDTGEPTEESSGGPPLFECPPDEFQQQCDVVMQDCPEGLRCVPWSTDGMGQPDATVCAPIGAAPAARYEPCALDPSTCSDDCGPGDYCALIGDAGDGICLGLCDGSGDDATCDEGDLCATCSECSVGTCFAGCDPLAPDCPDTMPSCFLQPVEPGFECLPFPEGGVDLGMQCDNEFACDPGLICANEDVLDGCDGLGACCTELCDLDDGDPGCSNPAHVCIPVFFPEPGPPGQEHVGYCGLLEADPCQTPGNCPPPGIDGNVPWCSLSNEAACRDGGLAGFFNGMACEQTCTCYDACEDTTDCPVPATGTAAPECVVEPYGPGSPTTCLYPCDGGEVCPDGMTCSEELGFGAICVWVSPLPPEECV